MYNCLKNICTRRFHRCVQHLYMCCPPYITGPDLGISARLMHVECMTHMHLTTECPGFVRPGGTLAVKLPRDDLFRAFSGPDHASAVLLATSPSGSYPVVAATACLGPSLLDPAAALPPPWRMKLQCLTLVVKFLLGVSSAACTRLPPSESVLASLHLLAWSSVHSWLLCLRFGSLAARRCFLRLLLFCTCPPLCAGALWPIPAWVWRDVRYVFFPPDMPCTCVDLLDFIACDLAWCRVAASSL